jgi:hypothetical protein
MSFDDSPDVKRDDDRAGDDNYGRDLANELFPLYRFVRCPSSACDILA